MLRCVRIHQGPLNYRNSLIEIKSNKIRLIISSNSDIIEVYAMIKYFVRLPNNRLVAAFILTQHNKGGEIGSVFSTYKLETMSFNDFCIESVSGGLLVNKMISDSPYERPNKLLGWELHFNRGVGVTKADLNLIDARCLEVEKNLLSGEY